MPNRLETYKTLENNTQIKLRGNEQRELAIFLNCIRAKRYLVRLPFNESLIDILVNRSRTKANEKSIFSKL